MKWSLAKTTHFTDWGWAKPVLLMSFKCLWLECKVIQGNSSPTQVLHFPSKVITQVVPIMVLSLPITQCHSASPAFPTLCCEMPSSHCCPHCPAACEPHLNPRFSLSCSPCSDCPCLYHPSSTFLDTNTIHSEGFTWLKWNWEKNEKVIYLLWNTVFLVERTLLKKSLMLAAIFHETSPKNILHQENIEYGPHCVGIHLMSLQVRCLAHICHLCSFGRSDIGTSGK